MSFLKKLFGNYSKRELKRIQPICNAVLALETKYQSMFESDLKGMTAVLKERLANGETLDDILPDAFAVCREASWRVLGMKHFPVQIIGGIVLHQGRIAEMRTGEGKTLVATLPAYLNALSGKGVHVVTVNDYLARRDSEWMGKLYRYLGLTVGLVTHSTEPGDKKSQYLADITYGTNNEFGFDYLRDNMVPYLDMKSQRGHFFAIVDEVDSILIDEARTPLIISGKGDKSTELYTQADKFARTLQVVRVTEEDTKADADTLFQDADYIVDEKARNATLTANGVRKAERFFNIENLTDSENITIQHHINQAIRARGVMQRDIDYVVKDGAVLIVDEFTGRILPGRRYNEGLHQAIEAKENVKVERESKTLATITFQNYFRLYDKLSGMTGTAMTEEAEFREIYNLDVVEIPTNKPMIRTDMDDVVFKTERGKFNAVIENIIECNQKGQPVLVGTISIEKSEMLSALLKKRGIKHVVLNAKFHDQEAEIVAQAGKLSSVTIATNMAGRGTDIVLGGNAEYLAKSEMRRMQFTEELIVEATGFSETDDEDIKNARETFAELHDKYKRDIQIEADKVRAAGGLFIIGTERHESRRIDNQLRGRSGRQGDPGASRFYVSAEDDLMRLFGEERLKNIMDRFRIDENMPLEAGMVSSTIESAQQKVEARNFGIRKHVLQFDDVMNVQRKVIYEQRDTVLQNGDVRESVRKMVKDTIAAKVAEYISDTNTENWNITGLRDYYLGWLTTEDDLQFTSEELYELERDYVCSQLQEKAFAKYEELESLVDPGMLRDFERKILLQNVDTYWMEHIDAMEELKKAINLQAYGQRDPVVEYKFQGSDMFDEMITSIRDDTARMLLSVRVVTKDEVQRKQVAVPTTASGGGDGSDSQSKTVRKSKKTGRNDPCPCGSGKKYKKCCGQNQGADTP